MDIVSNHEVRQAYVTDQTNYVTQTLYMYWESLVTCMMYNHVVDYLKKHVAPNGVLNIWSRNINSQLNRKYLI